MWLVRVKIFNLNVLQRFNDLRRFWDLDQSLLGLLPLAYSFHFVLFKLRFRFRIRIITRFLDNRPERCFLLDRKIVLGDRLLSLGCVDRYFVDFLQCFAFFLMGHSHLLDVDRLVNDILHRLLGGLGWDPGRCRCLHNWGFEWTLLGQSNNSILQRGLLAIKLIR